MKHVFRRAAALLLVAAIFAIPVHATPSVSAQSHILMDANTGAILSGNQIHKRSLIASTTKIMTAVIVLESMDLQQIVSIPKCAVGVEGSSIYLQEGESLSVSDLLYGLMLHSGNDAAVALAILCAGSVPGFVTKMNEKAVKLGLTNTHFENPNGLDSSEHYSSAYDLAVLTAYALKIPAFAEIVSTKEFRAGTRYFRNHNRLLWMDEEIIGVKTGYTKAAGRILVSAMMFQGRTMIAVTINDGNDWKDHIDLFHSGKDCYSQRILLSKGNAVGSFPMPDGSTAILYAQEDMLACLTEADRPILKLKYPLYPMGTSGLARIDVYTGDLLLGQISAKWEVQHYGTLTKNHILPRNLLPSNCRTVDH